MDTVFYIIIAYIVPAAAWMVWKQKASARTFPLIIGILSYMCISTLRGLARLAILNESVRGDPWMFYILSALLSGVFEEAGRYLVFLYVMPLYDRRDDCISYGIGHGAIEIILTQSFFKTDIIDSLLSCADFATGIAFSAAMSVFVFAAANYNNKKLLAAAIGLHTFIDIIPAFYLLDNITVGELMFIYTLYVVILSWFAYLVYRSFREY
ncbi:MAG: YhfC family intramembrane metalloprotease [Oscillospiraceae bacterium]|nr:YhfC family intramembrane metalloprotease [Oscillospiraceae bacterium]